LLTTPYSLNLKFSYFDQLIVVFFTMVHNDALKTINWHSQTEKPPFCKSWNQKLPNQKRQGWQQWQKQWRQQQWRRQQAMEGMKGMAAKAGEVAAAMAATAVVTVAMATAGNNNGSRNGDDCRNGSIVRGAGHQ
jgi:hypothetical protein